MAHAVLPDDGVMLLHTITRLTMAELQDRGVPLTMDAARFAMFISREIFPGGHLAAIEAVDELATASGFTVDRIHSLRLHYARTLDAWAEALESRRDEAVAIQSAEVYERYTRYLTGCAKMFRTGYIDINQFTLTK
jgi:cyclopropane-fatty-acyl-phospholipid synthase